MKKRFFKKIINSIFLISILFCYNNNTLNITPIKELLQKYSEISYRKICDKQNFEILPFQICPSMPYKGTFEELFILEVPNGIVEGKWGYCIAHDTFIRESIWGYAGYHPTMNSYKERTDNEHILKINGKVAVIAQIGIKNYGHWILEILERLALLEISNTEYDWLYVSLDEEPFIKNIFDLWGFDTNKIISPQDDFILEADTLIIPSLVVNTDQGHKQFGNYTHPYTLSYVKNKLLDNALQKNIDPNLFSKRFFISRKDCVNSRQIINEEEVFKIFENKGFKRYTLSDFSIEEQIVMFHNAEIIISESGSGLANIIFCKPNTHIIELFHQLIPIDFWYCSMLSNLKYTPVNTLNIDVDFFSNTWSNFPRLYNALFSKSIVPLDKLYDIAKTLH